MLGAVSYVFPVINPVRIEGNTFYRLSCARKSAVPAFKPDIPQQVRAFLVRAETESGEWRRVKQWRVESEREVKKSQCSDASAITAYLK